jgi:hypothetical protein
LAPRRIPIDVERGLPIMVSRDNAVGHETAGKGSRSTWLLGGHVFRHSENLSKSMHKRVQREAACHRLQGCFCWLAFCCFAGLVANTQLLRIELPISGKGSEQIFVRKSNSMALLHLAPAVLNSSAWRGRLGIVTWSASMKS